jgi:hypothetical protein
MPPEDNPQDDIWEPVECPECGNDFCNTDCELCHGSGMVTEDQADEYVRKNPQRKRQRRTGDPRS